MTSGFLKSKMGIKKEYRLRKSNDFKETISKKKVFTNSSFVFYYSHNDLNSMRIGISVSSKLGHAVVRNKIKRQVRMMCQSLFDKADSFDFVIIVRKGYLNKTFEQNKNELSFIYSKFKKKGNHKD